MHRLISRLTVILSCIALSFAATRVTSSIRSTGHGLTVQTPCKPADLPAAGPLIRNKAPLPESPSPYDIRNFVDGEKELDLASIWKLLKIKSLNSSASENPDPGEYAYPQICFDCQADTFEYELDGRPGTEILLKVSDEMGRWTSYLVFSSIDATYWDEWRVVGNIDSGNNKYRMSQHKVFLGGGRSWLVITSQAASGSGVASYLDRVFMVSGSGVHQVLSYVSEGHQGGGGSIYSREFSGQLVSCELKGDLVTAEIATAAQYFGEDYLGGGDGIRLWEKRQKAIFNIRTGQSEQVLDVRRSTLSQRELEEVYNIDSLTEEGYFEYNSKELAAIATGNDAGKREWLRRFLAEGEDTVHRQLLRRLLAGRCSKE